MLDTLFLIANASVLPAWLLLALAPDARWTHRLVHSVLPPLLLGTAYVVGLATFDSPAGASFSSLDGVASLLGSRHGALVGWLHYLVFDLFVGAWVVRDARRRAIHQGYVVPCLLLTLMLGPAGLGLYLVLRLVLRRATALDETPARQTATAG